MFFDRKSSGGWVKYFRRLQGEWEQPQTRFVFTVGELMCFTARSNEIKSDRVRGKDSERIMRQRI